MEGDTIPEDLRHLRDFPTFDTTFQDKPNLRQSLHHWVLKTEKIGNALASFVEALEQFHSSGLEHLAASKKITRCLQEFSSLCSNRNESTLSKSFTKVSEKLDVLWTYYETFLGHIQLLNISPIKELSAIFTNLKKVYEEVQFYRSQYIKRAEELCACRHLSNMQDKAHFNMLTEECYTSQKTYRLLLSKYLTSLRQANTKDMVTMLKVAVEHILSQFAYHRNCSVVLTDFEPDVTVLFSNTKRWGEFYVNELEQWGKLHTRIQRNILAEFQLEMGIVQHDKEAWAECSSKSYKPYLKKSHNKEPKSSPNLNSPLPSPCPVVPISSDWVAVDHDDCSSLDKSIRSPAAHHNTISFSQRTQSSPFFDTTSSDRSKTDPLRKKNSVNVIQLMTEGYRSISDPDLTSVDEDKERASISSAEMDLNEAEVPQGAIIGSVKQRGASMGSSDGHRIRVRYSDNSLERSEVSKMLENLKTMSSIGMGQQNGSARNNHHHDNQQAPPSGKSSSKWTIGKKLKGGGKSKESGGKAKKMSKGFHSSEDILEQSESSKVQGGGGVAGGRGEGDPSSNRSSSDSPQDSQPSHQHSSPVPRKKNTTGIFGKKKKKASPVVPFHHSPSPQDDAFDKEGSTPPPDILQEEGQSSSTAENEGRATPKSAEGMLSVVDHAPSRKAEQVVVGGGVQFNLDTLVLPLNQNWIKCGYLWLRMKLPNGRYAWTHIYCVVDREKSELMIQEQALPEPRRLENLMLCNTRPCTPNFIDRNYCFRVISPSSEHLFQTISEHHMKSWVSAMQETTEEALKHTTVSSSKRPTFSTSSSGGLLDPPINEPVPEAMTLILSVPGNQECADCSSTLELEWASVNLGIVICIKCCGVHRGLGVHVSKVKSLNLDSWDRGMVDFMQLQGNTKSNSYYESTLGQGADVTKPMANADKDVRKAFIHHKYVALAFVPESGDDRSTQL